MNGPKCIIAEEPLGPNSNVEAFDESLKQLVLSDFSIGTAHRYSLLWPRDSRDIEHDQVEVFGMLIDALSAPSQMVVGWQHDPAGPHRIRNLHLLAALKKDGWSVASDGRNTVATHVIGGDDFARVHQTVHQYNLGYFLAFGKWMDGSTLLTPPFLPTIALFCWTHKLSPSAEFISNMCALAGAVAYSERSDDRLPAVRIIGPAQLAKTVRELFSSVRFEDPS